jgi:hypothetical protein
MTTRDSLGGQEHRAKGPGSASSSLAPSIVKQLKYRLRGLDKKISRLDARIRQDWVFTPHAESRKRKEDRAKLDAKRKAVRDRLKGRLPQ